MNLHVIHSIDKKYAILVLAHELGEGRKEPRTLEDIRIICKWYLKKSGSEIRRYLSTIRSNYPFHLGGAEKLIDDLWVD